MKSPETILNATRRYRRTVKGLLTNSYHKQIERCKKNGRELPSYSLRELQDKFLNNKQFLKIYDNWVKSGYKYYDKPSIDRIDNTKSYTLDNLQILSWRQNRRKGDIESSHLTTQVIQCDMDGSTLAIYESIKEAVKRTGCHQGLISACCQGTRTHTGGYKWKYGIHRRK